jgi:drug/metabolite transporter (DMT)-like permease
MEIASPNRTTTSLLAVFALVAFAANSVLCRLALGDAAIDPASYTVVRLIAGALALALIALFSRRPSSATSGASWASAAMLFLYAASFSFAYISLSTGVGALILFASVQITMVGIGLYRGERPQPSEWVGLFIALIGLIYLVSPGMTAPPPVGSALMATAGFAWGIYSLQGRGAIDPVRTTTANFLRAAPIALAMLFLWLSNLKITPPGLFLAVISGTVTSGIGYVIWYAALKGLTATRAATVQLSVPVIAAFGGVVFLSEEISLRLLLSAVAILGGVGLAVSSHMAGAKNEICQRV